ncbi:hypothetical protein [Rudaea sp.]|uniref:hypothetical protein n=1 Tax=Rudaea sp. TaxID=2136325 RepID=UPI0032208AE4
MDSQTLTLSHVVISLIAIASGLAVLCGLLVAARMRRLTLLFLIASVATNASGFLFHREHILPSHIVGAIALVVLAITMVALYVNRLSGVWRGVYVIGAVMSLYFNMFVLVAQAFLKVPSLHELAPKGSEPPFAIAQGVLLVIFITVGTLAFKRFRPVAAR